MTYKKQLKYLSIAIKAIMSVTLLITTLCSISSAEFLQTRAGIFQHDGLRHKVVITEQGIFFAETKPIPLQMFNPSSLKNSNTIHGFLYFDQDKNRYTKFSIKDKQYRIAGGFNLRLGDLSVKVDNNNPYVSFVSEGKKKNKKVSSILGVLGLSVVVNTEGNAVVALLEANTQFHSYKDVIKDYYQKEDKLYLGDLPVSEDFIGVNLEGQRKSNPCTSSEAVILTSKEYEKLKTLRHDRNKGLLFLKRLMKSQSSNQLLGDLLFLRIDEQSVVALDYVQGEIKIISKLPEANARTVCVIENISIE